jgi:hypothetical protein
MGEPPLIQARIKMCHLYFRRAPKWQKATQLSLVAPTKNSAKALNQKNNKQQPQISMRIGIHCILGLTAVAGLAV